MNSSSELIPFSDVAVEFAKQRYQKFLTQDKVSGELNVTFQFTDGKILYADSFTLRALSEYFHASLSETWKTTDDSIAITAYGSDDFMNFLKFFYLCNCEISIENVKVMVDLAEFYQVKLLKDKCDGFLAEEIRISKCVCTFYDLIQQYELSEAKIAAMECISFYSTAVILDESFMSASKEAVMDIVKYQNLNVAEEVLYERVLQWAEKQSHDKTRNESTDKSFIAELLKDILSYIRFALMSPEFLNSFVVLHGYVFAHTELQKILNDAVDRKQNQSLSRKSAFIEDIRLIFEDATGNEAYVQGLNSAYEDCLVRYGHASAQYHGLGYAYWRTNLPQLESSCDTSEFTTEDFVVFRHISKDLAVAQYKDILNGKLRSTGIIGKLVGLVSIDHGLSFSIRRNFTYNFKSKLRAWNLL